MEVVIKTTNVVVVPIVLLMVAAAPGAWAWGRCGWNGCGYYWGGGCPGSGDYTGGIGHLLSLGQNGLWGGEGGYYAGQQDAIYDHDNNLAYNPIGECLSCHSELYWHNLRYGYDHQWNSYQNQESTQGTSINIYGNNNYVSTNQYSGQNQDQQQEGSNPNCWSSCDGGP